MNPGRIPASQRFQNMNLIYISYNAIVSQIITS